MDFNLQPDSPEISAFRQDGACLVGGKYEGQRASALVGQLVDPGE